MGASNTSAAPPSGSATSRTTSPAACSKPAASDPCYTACESSGWLVWDWLTGLAPAAWP